MRLDVNNFESIQDSELWLMLVINLIKIMRKLTQEQKQMMDRAIKFAPARQIFMWVWWEIFCHRKADKLIKCVEVGMTWFAAYTIAKNVRFNLLRLPRVGKSVCHCDERDRVEEDGELYCIKCGSKWD